MNIVSLASAKGSPGVTTTALALASWWPRPSVVVEVDPAGGDFAARLGLAEEPGLVGLAAQLRRNVGGSQRAEGWLEPHLQQSSGGISLVTAPASSDQASAAVELLSALATLPHPEEVDLIVDMGRLTGTGRWDRPSPQPRWHDAGEAFVWVCRPKLADLAHLAAQVEHRGDDGQGSMVVLAGDGPYPADEVATALGVTVLGHLPADPSGAAALWAGGGRTWAHSALGRATKDLAAALAELLARASIGGAQSLSGAESQNGAEDEPLGSPGKAAADGDLGGEHIGAATARGIR